MSTLPHDNSAVKDNGVLYTVRNGYSSYCNTVEANPQADLLTNIPAELQELKQWVTWRYEPRPTGKPAKRPYRPFAPQRPADITNSRHWATFEQALYVAECHSFSGIGFVLSQDDPFVGIDFDYCVNADGTVNPDVAGWLATLDSYSEYSPSGTGIHVIVCATLRLGRKVDAHEIYGQDRFFAVTGNRVPGTPGAIREAQEAVDSFVAHLGTLKPQAPHNSPTAASLQPLDNSDSALLRRMFASKSGQRLWSLWHNTDTENHSVGDMVLCSALAFWTSKDADRMERLFKQSNRVRDKLSHPARLADTDYLSGTIRIAIANCTKVYGGRNV